MPKQKYIRASVISGIVVSVSSFLLLTIIKDLIRSSIAIGIVTGLVAYFGMEFG